MKKLIILAVLAMILAGCANMQAYNGYKNYMESDRAQADQDTAGDLIIAVGFLLGRQ